ncbi:TM2 domain-containing protein [Hyphococcus sp.]|uniref:TM2 domain-containing protein n=1 Tax=Hyphococcus sp. TaxID=2038636 RepID=UPI0035C75828
MSDHRWEETGRSHEGDKPKKMWIAYLFWLFLGILAAHRFYLRKNGWLQLFTVLLFGIGLVWVLADLFLIPSMVRHSRTGGEPAQRDPQGRGLILKIISVIFISIFGLCVIGYLIDPEALDGHMPAAPSADTENSALESEGEIGSLAPDNIDGSRPNSRSTAPEDRRRFAAFDEIVDGRRISASISGISITYRAGNEFIGEDAQPEALFVIVEYEYTNISDRPIGPFNSPDISLIAPSGAEYNSDNGATGLEMADRELNENALSDLNPMITYRSVELFEVAEGLFHQPGWIIKVELDRTEFFVRIEE